MTFTDNILQNINRWSGNLIHRHAIRQSSHANPIGTMIWGNDKPKWMELSQPEHFEKAVRFNPVVKNVIDLLSEASSNGRRCLIDPKTGEEMPWDTNEYTKKAKRLFIDRPNPQFSGKEFDKQGSFYYYTFGNRYVYGLMGASEVLDLMEIEALWNLPSQYMSVKDTGKIYKQYQLEGIISEYARTNVSPTEKYKPSEIIHFAEVNITSEAANIMGISKLEALAQPISNLEACYAAMNTLLRHGGAKGIISVDSRDGQGTIQTLIPEEKEEMIKTFITEYGLQDNQSPHSFSPIPVDYQKVGMNATEMGIYEEHNQNAALISNEFNVPPDLTKIDPKSSTFDNQEVAERRMYQNAVIPARKGEDELWNYKLNLEKYGFKLTTKWDHIAALSENKKDNAMTYSLIAKTALSEYDDNLITWNQYLEATGKPETKNEDGNLLKYEREAKIKASQPNNNE